MSMNSYLVTPDSYEPALNIVGEQLTVLASAETTGHAEVFLQAGPEGSGPPPHSHPWGETFYVIRGEVALGIDGVEHVATPGTLVHFPPDTVHWFRFGAGGGEMLSLTPDSRATRFFRDLDANVDSHDPDVGKIVAVAERNSLTIYPPED